MEPTSIPMYILSIPCLRSVWKAYKTGGRKSKISIKYCHLISSSDPQKTFKDSLYLTIENL